MEKIQFLSSHKMEKIHILSCHIFSRTIFNVEFLLIFFSINRATLKVIIHFSIATLKEKNVEFICIKRQDCGLVQSPGHPTKFYAIFSTNMLHVG